MTSELVEQHKDLTKEELLKLEPTLLRDIRHEMGDQEFIDHWNFTQDEFTDLINDFEEEDEETTASGFPPVNDTKKYSICPYGGKEILYPTRREAGSFSITKSQTNRTSAATAPASNKKTISSNYVSASESKSGLWRTQNSNSYSKISKPTTSTRVVSSNPIIVGSSVPKPTQIHSFNRSTIQSTASLSHAPVVISGNAVNHRHGYYGMKQSPTGTLGTTGAIRTSGVGNKITLTSGNTKRTPYVSNVSRGATANRTVLTSSSTVKGPISTSYTSSTTMKRSYLS